ncbi:MAG TPA: NlpC/P60 family protein [Gaiellaceae bacterium]|nr:NlpC/P60 family protein [Gaiellaceae bacterium]
MKRLAAPLPLALVAALVVTASATPQPGSISGKEAQAQSVLNQIQSLDGNLEHAIEAYNLANERLKEVKANLAENRRELGIARANLRQARSVLAEHAVAVYTSTSGDSTLEVLLGATSLDEFLSRVDTVGRVSDQGNLVLGEVVTFQNDVRARRARLKRAKARAAELVSERAHQKASIESQLATRRSLLNSIRGEIARMQAAERARQAELERRARAQAAAAAAAPPVLATALTSETSSASSEPAAAATPAPVARYGGVVGIAMQYLGTPYVYGGASPSGFDCSGLIMYAFAHVGVSLPHNAAAQYGMGTPVDRSQLQPGDLVFFNGLGHAGIYVGGGSFIHSPHTGDVVKISSMSGWYTSTYVGARRL